MKLNWLPSVLIIMAPYVSNAQENDTKLFSYDYVELAYVHNNFNSDDVTLSNESLNATIGESTGNGGSVKASYQIVDIEKVGIYVTGEYYQTTHQSGIAFTGNSIANGTISVLQQEYRVGVGSFINIHKNIDIFGEVAYLDQENTLKDFALNTGQQGDLRSVSFSGKGVDVRLGFRAKITESFEVNGYVRRHPFGRIDRTSVDVLNFENQFKGNLGVRWYAMNNISIGADYEFGKPGHLRLGARLEF